MPDQPSKVPPLVEAIQQRFPDSAKVAYVKQRRGKILVETSKLRDVALFMRDSLGFDHVASVSGVDYPQDKQIEVVYHASSLSKQELRDIILAVAARTDREESKFPSLISVWRSVEYHERETHEMLGVKFEGHPKLERLLLPEDWNDLPPLRKEFKLPGRTE